MAKNLPTMTAVKQTSETVPERRGRVIRRTAPAAVGRLRSGARVGLIT